MSRTFDFETGEVLLVDKPFEWTSFDVVKKIRNTIRNAKVGHAGTLDPLATGLLIVCTGKFTKRISEIQDQEKEYTGEIRLGATTPSFDLETEVMPFERNSTETPTLEQLQQVAGQLTGKISQVPPVYSAIQKDGVRVYKMARKGETVVLEPRKVEIISFELFDYAYPSLKFKVVCSKGTYIRSLAHDFGQMLGVGGYLASLQRTRIGDFKIENSYVLSELITVIKAQP